MKRRHLKTIQILLGLFICLDGYSQNTNDSVGKEVSRQIQDSHITANAPEAKDFDSLLTRDLNLYFAKKYKNSNVKWVYLRMGATQSGVAYPKYYLWVSIFKNEQLITEGAVRVAAIEKVRFDITHFVDINQMKDKSVDIYSIFPAAVCEKIERRLK